MAVVIIACFRNGCSVQDNGSGICKPRDSTGIRPCILSGNLFSWLNVFGMYFGIKFLFLQLTVKPV